MITFNTSKYIHPEQMIYEYDATTIANHFIEGKVKEAINNKNIATDPFIFGMDRAIFDAKLTENIETEMSNWNIYDEDENWTYRPTKDTSNFAPFNEKNIEITTIEGKITVAEAINIAKNVYEKHKNAFYGIIIDIGGMRINPLHPLIAYAINMQEPDTKIYESECKLHIYTLKQETIFSITRTERMKNSIINILAAIETERIISVEYKDFKVQETEYGTMVKYDELIQNIKTGEVIVSDEKDFVSNMLVPLQRAQANGIVFPNYGTVFCSQGGAWNISPIASANVGIDENANEDNQLEYPGGICTHSGESTEKIGIAALNDSNYDSPMNSYTHDVDNSKEYTIASIEISLGIYENILKESEPFKKMTFREYIDEYPEATRKDYLEYLKKYLTEHPIQIEEPKTPMDIDPIDLTQI